MGRKIMGADVTENRIVFEEQSDDTGFGTDKYIHRIVTQYSDCIVKLSYTYVKNICDAEDVAQDVFMSLIKRNKPFESEEHEKAWLLRTAVNKSRNYLKSGWVKRTVSAEEIGKENIPAENEYIGEESEVMEAVLSLPEKYRVPIHLFYYGGYSINEIAGIMRKKPATVGTLLARGREKLKAVMIGGFDDE
jgi:RNA polymerase sigma-70 factor (ECF subfamily)